MQIRGSKSHTERILELNTRTLLNELPNGNQFRITSNGRIVKKSQETRASNEHTETRIKREENYQNIARPIDKSSIRIAYLNVCGWTKSNRKGNRSDLTLVVKGYPPSSPYTIKFGVDALKYTICLQNFKCSERCSVRNRKVIRGALQEINKYQGFDFGCITKDSPGKVY